MRYNENHWGILVLTTCIALSVTVTGCRSGKSNLFSFRSEPSPEALAGNGPSTTYPAPPSESATPEAIASVAGGTGSPATTSPASATSPAAQVAGLDVTPSYITPASTNMAAAQTNGFHGGTKSAGFQTPATDPPAVDSIVPAAVTAPKTGTSGYQFGTNPAAKPSGTSSYNMPSSYTAPQPSANDSAAVTKAGGGSGFTMPSDVAGAVKTAAATAVGCQDCDGCPACQTTAPKSAAAITASATSNGGYSPGSTGTAAGYPSAGSSYLR